MDIQKVLTEEIQRQAKQEAAAALAPLKTQIAQLSAQVAEQKGQISQLQKKAKIVETTSSATTPASKSTVSAAKPTKESKAAKAAAAPVTKTDTTAKSAADSAKSSKMVGDRIKKLRQKYGLSQNEFAKMLGVCYATVARWEAGTCKPSNDTVARIVELAKMGKQEFKKQLSDASETF